jgi:uncharacterized protein
VIVQTPVLHDHAIREAIEGHRSEVHALSRRRDPEELALVCAVVTQVKRDPVVLCDQRLNRPETVCLYDHVRMKFDRYTISLLLLRSDAPAFTEEKEAELQDAHMSHLADLYEAGQLLAAGPVLGAPDRELRGFSILSVDPERARELKERDPAVRAGVYRIEVFPWSSSFALQTTG